MIGTLLSWTFGPVFHRVTFPHQAGDGTQEKTSAIFDAFEVAAQAGMRGVDAEQMRTLETDVPWNLRPFFWEGHALGVCATHACTWRSGHPNIKYQTPHFRFMFYTGLGFWNGMVLGTPLPRMSLDPARWSDVPDFLACYPLITGGMAFALTCKRGALEPDRVLALPDLRGETGVRGAFQGCGRALWFLYMGDIERVFEVIDAHPEYADALAEGIGVAITYTGLNDPPGILRTLAQVPEQHRREVLMGIRLCLGAFVEDDPREYTRISTLPGALPALFHQGAEALLTGPRDADWDTALLAALRAQPDPTVPSGEV